MNILAGIIFIAVGIFNVLNPKAGLAKENERKNTTAKPTGWALLSRRIIGVMLVLAGAAFFFMPKL